MAVSEGSRWYPERRPATAGPSRSLDRERGRTAAPAVAVHHRRPPWWVLAAGGVALLGCSGWVAAQPLPPSQPSPALQSVETQLQQQAAQISTLQSQAKQWESQRAQVAAQLQQEENTVAGLTGQAAPPPVTSGLPSVNVSPPRITMSRGS